MYDSKSEIHKSWDALYLNVYMYTREVQSIKEWCVEWDHN